MDFPAAQGFLQEDMLMLMEGSASGTVFQTGKSLALSGPAWHNSELHHVGAVVGSQCGCFLPLLSRHRVLGVLQLARPKEQAFIQHDIDFLNQVANQVAIRKRRVPGKSSARAPFTSAAHAATTP
jgi:formate hydrogenlyase transcriptional activator